MFDATPVIARIRRRLGGVRELREAADESWLISPQETTHPDPAICLEDDVDRIRNTLSLSDLPTQLRIIRGEPPVHQETRAYRLRNVKLLDGELYAGGFILSLRDQKRQLAYAGTLPRERVGTLACSQYGNRFFGDWLIHDGVLNPLARELGNPVEVARPLWSHEPFYRDLLQYEATAVTRACFDELIVIDDLGENSHKRERHRRNRELVQRIPASHPNGRVFIKRGTTGVRRMLRNESEIESRLAGLGFRIIEPERMTAEELVHQLRGSRVVVGVEGSQLAHALYAMASGGVLVVIQPPDRFNAYFKAWLDSQNADLRFAFTVGKRCGEDDFELEPDRLERLLDLLD